MRVVSPLHVSSFIFTPRWDVALMSTVLLSGVADDRCKLSVTFNLENVHARLVLTSSVVASSARPLAVTLLWLLACLSWLVSDIHIPVCLWRLKGCICFRTSGCSCSCGHVAGCMHWLLFVALCSWMRLIVVPVLLILNKSNFVRPERG